MTMTRKDYNALAEAIRVTLRDHVDPTVADVAESIADTLYDAGGLNLNGNRRFDRDRFLKAAGIR